MATHTLHTQLNETYFCTITCHNWLNLFEEAKAYSSVYTWFEHLIKDDCQILGYVIMPNHIHCLLFPRNPEKVLNTLVGEGKRFMAYKIIGNLKKMKNYDLLNKLSEGVQENEKKNGKKHQVFKLSFDARICYNQGMIEQKLDYIHHNPVKGKWSLVDDFATYLHSSAGYYELGIETKYIVHYKALNDDE